MLVAQIPFSLAQAVLVGGLDFFIFHNIWDNPSH
jgi:hypothetical protein